MICIKRRDVKNELLIIVAIILGFAFNIIGFIEVVGFAVAMA